MWNFPVKDSNLTKEIESKIQEIYLVLNNQEILPQGDFSLTDGQCGPLLFNNYFGLFNKTTSEIFTEKCLSSMFQDFSCFKAFNFSMGLSGMLWTTNHLCKSEFIEVDEEIFTSTSNIIHEALIEISELNNFDYLHGSFGIVLYLLERPETIDQKVLEKWLDIFLSTSEDIDGKLSRKTNMNEQKGYCIGLAHGTPHVILILIKYLKKFNSVKGYEILAKTINFLRSVKRDTPNNFFFPSSIINGVPEKGRLAWCYGDLGCAFALYKAGEFLEKKSLIEEANLIMLNAAKLRGPEENHIYDADFCHGTVGVAHFFARYYNYTKCEDFRIASEYWFKKTIEKAKFEDGLAGYKHFNGISGLYEPRYALLEGVSGLGLSLISSISDIEPKWDSCLLLS